MTEPPQPPSTPDEPWNAGDPGRQHPRPGYPQSGYSQPGYQPGYPQAGYPQPGYPQPEYAPPGYPQPGYPQPGYPPAGPAGINLTARLGARLARRPEPRFGISLAAAGIGLLFIGILVWAGGYVISGIHVDFNADTGTPLTSGGSRRFLGAGLSALVVVIGYALVIIRRGGPLATAGAVGTAIGVPFAIVFASFDISNTFSGAYPFNVDAVFIVSILAALISYFVIPGAQGRAFYLGLAAIYLYSYVGLKASGGAVLRTAASTLNSAGLSAGGSDTSGAAAVALIFGLAYYGIAAFLDRRGRAGAAIALVVAGFAATLTGVIAGASSFGRAGTGALLLVLGAGLAWYGGYFGRRFTTWVWSAGFVTGVVLIVSKISPNNFTAAGISMIVLGGIVVIGAQLLSAGSHERPDIDDARVPVAPG